jgi:hypothetical protein
VIVPRDMRIDGGPVYSVAFGMPSGEVVRDAMASDLARIIASHTDDDPALNGPWLALWLECFATMEMDIGVEPSHHRYQSARLSAFHGFVGFAPPEYAKRVDAEFGWLVRLLYEEYRQ